MRNYAEHNERCSEEDVMRSKGRACHVQGPVLGAV